MPADKFDVKYVLKMKQELDNAKVLNRRYLLHPKWREDLADWLDIDINLIPKYFIIQDG